MSVLKTSLKFGTSIALTMPIFGNVKVLVFGIEKCLEYKKTKARFFIANNNHTDTLNKV